MFEDIYNRLYRHKLLPDERRPGVYDVVFGLDGNLFNPLLVAMLSCINAFKRDIRFHILQSDFSAEKKRQLNDFCVNHNVNLSIYDVDPKPFEAFQKGRFPNQCFYYLLAHNLLPDSVERALVLDIDILAQKDIAAFYDTDFEDAWLVACNEYDHPYVENYLKIKAGDANLKHIHEHLHCTECLFNSGVVVMNLKKFRENNVSLQDYLDLRKAGDEKTLLRDQLLLNRFTGADVKLYPKFFYNSWAAHETCFRDCFKAPDNANEIYRYFTLEEELTNSIIHFTAVARSKPWLALTTTPARDEYAFVKLRNADIDRKVKIWWQTAKNIPVQNFIELANRSISHNFKIEEQGKVRPATFNPLARNSIITSEVLGCYNSKILLGPSQLELISYVIASRGPDCRLLIFGCGHDSPYWASLNKSGLTLFMETTRSYYDELKKSHPQLNILLYGVGGNTVKKSLDGEVEILPIPAQLSANAWDVILIDGPQGFNGSCPGRALPIIWTSSLRSATTHIFVDDYERELEKTFTERYIGKVSVIRDERRAKAELAWHNGDLNQ